MPDDKQAGLLRDMLDPARLIEHYLATINCYA